MQYEITSELRQRLANLQLEQNTDPNIRKIKTSILRKEKPRYCCNNDILYKLMEEKWKIVLPISMLE